jgi:tyrosyl-tRNA synthetase
LRLSSEAFLEIFQGVPQAHLSRKEFEEGLPIVDVLASKTGFLSSNGEARRALKANSISVNKEKVTESFQLDDSNLINGKYLLLGKGKKSNFIVVID